MGILTSELPDLPEDVSDKFFITYKKYDYDNEYHYVLTSVNSEYFTGLVDSNFKISADLTDNWVLVDNQWHSTFDKTYSSYRNFYATDIMYSSYDIYSESGEFYYPESNYDFEVNLIGSTMTSSSISHSLKSEFIPTVLVVVAAVVVCIGFRKAWSFFIGSVRGA